MKKISKEERIERRKKNGSFFQKDNLTCKFIMSYATTNLG
jgi:hypothetical protein